MKLVEFQVTNFQSVDDSELIKVDQVTCLVGKNEAGKSAILKALHKLNPISEECALFDPTDDYPRSRVTEYKADIDLPQLIGPV